MEKASFSFKRYSFTEAHLSLKAIPEECSLKIKFEPAGEFHAEEQIFSMTLGFVASYNDMEVVNISLEADFEFNGISELEDVPDYFYPNSLAIVYPYVRAFVSTLSLQANIHPLLLPTINLSSLKEEFKKHTIVK